MTQYVFDGWLYVEASSVDEAQDRADKHYAAHGYPLDRDIGYWNEESTDHFSWTAN